MHLLVREIKILKELDHPNIIKFFETYEDKKYLHIVMEHCKGGELLERVIKKGNLSEKECAKIMSKLFSAVNYLHNKGISHRDLKLENLLFSNNSFDSEIKIIDFGLSKNFYDETNKNMTTTVGTPIYIAPEVLTGNYDFSCDNWSLGVIMYILLYGTPPFIGPNSASIFTKIKTGKFSLECKEKWQIISKKAKNLIKKLLVVNPRRRIKAGDAAKHAWFNKGKISVDNGDKEIDPKIISLLRNFRGVQKFRKEALKVIVSQLEENEIKNLKEAFRKFDRDNSGKICYNELKTVMTDLGYETTEQELKNIMKTCDIDDNTFIYYSEFITATLDKKFYLGEEKLWSCFKYFDVDNTNFITVNNLKEALARAGKNLKEEDLVLMIKEHDKAKNGVISFEEFKDMMEGGEFEEI